MAKGSKTGGRQKGSKNKFTFDLKNMILNALDDAGGKQYLINQSRSNATAFMALVGKVLPLTLVGDKDNPVHTQTSLSTQDADLINRYLAQKAVK